MMNELCYKYLRNLASELPAVNEKLNKCFQHWLPESPPSTVVFGELGDAIADHFHEIPAESRVKLFAQIEDGVISSNPEIATAVATGLIEALVTKADEYPKLWEEFEKLFGARSRIHALAWRNFGGS